MIGIAGDGVGVIVKGRKINYKKREYCREFLKLKFFAKFWKKFRILLMGK